MGFSVTTTKAQDIFIPFYIAYRDLITHPEATEEDQINLIARTIEKFVNDSGGLLGNDAAVMTMLLTAMEALIGAEKILDDHEIDTSKYL